MSVYLPKTVYDQHVDLIAGSIKSAISRSFVTLGINGDTDQLEAPVFVEFDTREIAVESLARMDVFSSDVYADAVAEGRASAEEISAYELLERQISA